MTSLPNFEEFFWFTPAETPVMVSGTKPCPQLYYFMAMACYAQNDTEGAIKNFEAAVVHSPGNKYPEASNNLGVMLKEKGDNNAAIVHYQKAIDDALGNKYPDATFNLGVCFEEQGDVNSAILHYQKAIDDAPERKYPKASFNLGVCLKQQGDIKGAILHFQKAINDTPGNKYPDASNNLGVLLKEQGDIDGAIIQYKKAINDAPGNKYYVASYNLAESFKELGNNNQALIQFRKTIDDAPGNKFHLASYNLGVLLYEEGNTIGAMEQYRKAIQDKPDNKYPDASNNLGVLLEEQGDINKAIVHYQKAIDDSPGNKYHLASYNLGACLKKQEDTKGAIIQYKKAIDDAPGKRFATASFNLGAIKKDLGEYHNAIYHLQKAIRDDGEQTISNKVWLLLSQIYLAQNNWSAARHAAYTGLAAFDTDIGLLQHIHLNFNPNSCYTSREALATLLVFHCVNKTAPSFNLLFRQNDTGTAAEPACLYAELLLEETDLFQTGLTQTERTRLACLYMAAYGQYHWVFYILDYILDTIAGYSFDEAERYLHWKSAVETGAPRSDLEALGSAFRPGNPPTLVQADEYLVQPVEDIEFTGYTHLARNPLEQEVLQEMANGGRPASPYSIPAMVALYFRHLQYGHVQPGEPVEECLAYERLKNAVQAAEFKPGIIGQEIHDLIGIPEINRLYLALYQLSLVPVTDTDRQKTLVKLQAYAVTRFETIKRAAMFRNSQWVAGQLLEYAANQLGNVLNGLMPIVPGILKELALSPLVEWLTRQGNNKWLLPEDISWEVFEGME